MLKTINLDLKVKIATNSKGSDLIIVNTHERSGTHYLINTIDYLFQHYKAKPYLNLDLINLCSLINFYDPRSLEGFFKQLIEQKNLSIMKSHFSAEFFYNLKNEVLKKIKFFFIYREPINALKSFWIFIHNCDWYEGPKINNFKEFCFSQPRGKLLRYQHRQYENFILRYLYMIKGWSEFSKKNNNILMLTYEDLDTELPAVTKKIETFLNLKAINNNKFDRSEYLEVKFNKRHNLLSYEKDDISIINEYIFNKAEELGIKKTLLRFK